jgi:hypothetical protein
MPIHSCGRTLTALAFVALMSHASRVHAQEREWGIHDLERPRPRIVNPGPAGPPLPPPADAIVLFDGTALTAWQNNDGAAAPWRVADGFFEVVPGSGGIRTREAFGDVQLHIEWSAPAPRRGEGQEPGNSGVFFMGTRYEVQVLDSHGNETYADGQAGAIYGQFPPLVNVTRPPGEWQTYDIIFRRPRFDASGNVTSPAFLTVIHNGVLIHDHVALMGPTAHRARPPYSAHPDRLPISLQDHGERVRFRNVWVRDLER